MLAARGAAGASRIRVRGGCAPGADPAGDQRALPARLGRPAATAAGDPSVAERPAGQRRGPAQRRHRAAPRDRQRRLGRSDLRLRDLVRGPPTSRGPRRTRRARRKAARDHHHLHGRHRETSGGRAGPAGRGGAGGARCAHDEAAREGLAAGARLGPEHRVRRLLQPLPHRALRRPRVERAAVIRRRRPCDRPGPDDVRQPLGVRALRPL